MTIHWAYESCDRRDDPVSGARIIQLTSAAAISNNIYGEQPYCSPDGRRLVIARCTDFCFDEAGSLLVHELDTLKIAMVARNIVGVRGVFNSAWSGLIYYWTQDRQLTRLSLTTLEQEVVYVEEDPAAPLPGSSVSPDQRYVIGSSSRLEGPGAPTFQIVRLDLQKGKREVIFEHPEICNPHLQFNPITGRQVLVQNNRGVRLEKDGTFDHRGTKEGCTLFVIDADGTNMRYLPVGPPITMTATGHECFVADTGRVLFSVAWNQSDDWTLDRRFPTGNMFTAAPGDEEPTVFEAPEQRFNHICASRCGEYFVADSHAGNGLFEDCDAPVPGTGKYLRLCAAVIRHYGELKAVSLVVGNLRTGKYRTLVADTMVSTGGNQCTHTHPYLTADSRYVIFNADPYYSPPQVFAAVIPEGFLESLS